MMIYRYVLAEKSCGKYFGVVDGACDCVPQSHSECKEADAENYHVYLGPLSVLPVPLSTSFRTGFCLCWSECLAFDSLQPYNQHQPTVFTLV